MELQGKTKMKVIFERVIMNKFYFRMLTPRGGHFLDYHDYNRRCIHLIVTEKYYTKKLILIWNKNKNFSSYPNKCIKLHIMNV